ncbi:MAG TPA: hypothetical protein VMZ27_07835 [Candidatus Saccharimonadales bacterium]|nr:hypothetical protein [Candidatus Saccharimonadales bacterium]
MRDLSNPKAIYLKAVLFLFLGTAACLLLWMDSPTWKTLLLLILGVWSFCRVYYFAFYVIERYVDPTFKFSGLWAFVRYLIAKKHP